MPGSLFEPAVATPAGEGDGAIAPESENKILVLIEPDENVGDALLTLLKGQGWAVELMSEASALQEFLENQQVLALITEASLPGTRAVDVLRSCKQRDLPVIFTGHDLPAQAAVDLIKQGAHDYLEKPFSRERLLDLLNKLPNRHNIKVNKV